MKAPLQRTKVVIRHLPPNLSQSDLLSLFHDRFSDRYSWFSFRQGKSSHKHKIQRFSRAYVELKSPEDVLEFAQLLNGHVFVNNKGTQFTASVEYAPSQRVSKPCTRKDSREGTIYKDPEYLEFLKLIAKPVEHLPSAEFQLERKEAEQSAAVKEAPIVTPLMEYVRQKRATNIENEVSSAVRKVSRRSKAASTAKSGSAAPKRGSEKKKYIQKGSVKNASQKDKLTFIAAPKREDEPISSNGKEISESEIIRGVEGSVKGITLTSDSGNKKILLLKGKEREISQQQGETSSVGNSTTTSPKEIQRREGSGRLIRSLLLNSEAHQTSWAPVQSHQKLENGKLPPQTMNKQSGLEGHVSNNEQQVFTSASDIKRAPEDRLVRKVPNGLGVGGEKQDKRIKHRDRTDRGVRARHSDALQAARDHSSSSQQAALLSKSIEVNHRDIKEKMRYGSKNDQASVTSSGGFRHKGRRVDAHFIKDDGCVITSESKSFKKGVAAGSSAPEKKVWIQKSSRTQ